MYLLESLLRLLALPAEAAGVDTLAALGHRALLEIIVAVVLQGALETQPRARAHTHTHPDGSWVGPQQFFKNRLCIKCRPRKKKKKLRLLRPELL